MTERLSGKVALITGAARGQGRAHAVRLAREGADILAVDIVAPLPGVFYESATPEDLDETVRLVEAQGRQILAHRGDVRDGHDLREFVDSAVAAWGRLDIIIANAGICIPELWNDVTPKSFQDHLDINVTGVWNTVMAGARHVIAGGRGGSIVLTSSYAGKKVQPFMVHYTTSKHAVTGMTRAFAAELGRYDVRVNSIHPGVVGTAMGSGEMAAEIARIYAQYPRLAPMGTPFIDPPHTSAEEVAACVAFLVSDEARFITAEHLSIDGGAHYF